MLVRYTCTRKMRKDVILNFWNLAWQGVRFHRWMLVPVSMGVAVATAVIVGALLVGDSVRGSLKFLATDRLGGFTNVLVAPKFFDQSVLSQSLSPQSEFGPLEPQPIALFPKATVSKSGRSDATKAEHRSGNAMVLGVTKRFWAFGEKFVDNDIPIDEVVINESLAEQLHSKVGDKITIRLPSQAAVPADSPLGKRESETVNLPGLKVSQIIPNRSIGRFDLRSNQRPSMNAFVSIKAIQQALDRPGQVNAAFWGIPIDEGGKVSLDRKVALENSNLESLPMSIRRQLSLEDFGYQLERVTRKFPDEARGEKVVPTDKSQTIYDYYQITSDQMLIHDSVAKAVRDKWPAPSTSAILTYLANGIEITTSNSTRTENTNTTDKPSQRLSIPYSTITAIDPKLFSEKSIGFDDESASRVHHWQDDEVVVNEWLAGQLEAKIGDSLDIAYFLPETVDGAEVEKSWSGKVVGIVPLTEPEVGYRRQRPPRFANAPTPFNDTALTPEVPGITDQASISDWNLPFALTRKIRNEDDDYWTNHRLSPKLFLTLNKGQELFGSRFGSISSIRISVDTAESEDALRKELLQVVQPLMEDLGWNWLPIRSQQLHAASGTTPFDMLFLALSFFVILAALILVLLLFRLGIERRASQWGCLLATGWTMAQVRRLLLIEGLFLATVGGVLGMLLGIGYAFGVLELLRSWWVGAVGAPFLQFFMTGRSLIVGGMAGIATTLVAVWFAVRSLDKLSAIQLLRGQTAPVLSRSKLSSNRTSYLIAGLLLLTIAVTMVGCFVQGQAAGGAFVGAGMLGLATMLLEVWRRLQKSKEHSRESLASGSLAQLATSSIRRQPMRSALTMGLMAVATLLILSMSLFEMAPSVQGTGGFQWLVESNFPVAKSLNDESYLRETLGDKSDSIIASTIVPLRVRDGDDAGCNNLYQASQPRMLGVSPRMEEYAAQMKDDSFAWAASATREKLVGNGKVESTPWKLLESAGDGSIDSPIPVIIDLNTAMWALHLTGGIGQRFSYSFDGKAVHFVTVALLQNTVMQGSLLIGEDNFKQLFPSISGYRQWLVHANDPLVASGIGKVLEAGWADEGMDAISTEVVLSNLLAVQNTYLKAFQSLGALGLLLGSIGLAVVQLRSVMERRSELGLMCAMGFSTQRVGRLILCESLSLLGAGLGIGCIAAGIALLPAILRGDVQPHFYVPFIMIAVVAICGTLASFMAVRQAMKLRVLEAIRQG
jgi:putative ABC transport system permease protein